MSTAAPTTPAPTSAPSTTSAPTTTLTTAAPTTAGPTTVPPTTPVPVEIEADPAEITLSVYSVISYWPPNEVNPALDQSESLPPVEIVISGGGEAGFVGIVADPAVITITGHGTGVDGVLVEASAGNIIISGLGDPLLDHELCNWIKWSKIGELDFTRDESNQAGKRPLDWKGCVYHIAQLGDKAVIYGENGVSIVKPSGVHFGMDTIYRIGLKNKGAFAGTERMHFFVDTLGQLWKFDSQLTKLDYSEFLSQMGTVILSLDIEKNLLYITDDTYGYVYSIDSNSLGQCPANVTGIGVQGTILNVVSDGAIVTPKFEICTDIQDFGTRKAKTIRSVEIGSNLSDFLYVSLDYRKRYKDSFIQIPWFMVNHEGKAWPTCYGVEFRVRVKSTIYEYFEVDYIKVKGNIHGWSYLDYSGEQ